MDHLDSSLIGDFISQFPLGDLFDELPVAADRFVEDVPAALSPDSTSAWIDELESFLMKDDDSEIAVIDSNHREFSDSFLEELLAESPERASGKVVDGSSDKDSGTSTDGVDQLEDEEEEKAEGEAAVEEDVGDDSPSKKRRRLLRNKDAAARSRERKKMYVKELEMKSKYLEGECRRLGLLLQCFVAENQALRIGLQNGGGCSANGTKQESAVLLLEFLLLGSLLWFLGIMCLFNLSPRLTLVSPGNDGGRDPQTCGPRGPRSEKFRHLLLESSVTSRRCRASRSKMKEPGIPVPRVSAC